MSPKARAVLVAALAAAALVKVLFLSGTLGKGWVVVAVPVLLVVKLLAIRAFLAHRKSVAAARPAHPEW